MTFYLLTSNIARVDRSALVNAAVTAFQRGEFTDYTKAAKNFKYNYTSVSKTIRGLTKTWKEVTYFYYTILTIEQEEVLIHYINHLTDQGIPPISSIVKNLAEEIRGCEVGKN